MSMISRSAGGSHVTIPDSTRPELHSWKGITGLLAEKARADEEDANSGQEQLRSEDSVGHQRGWTVPCLENRQPYRYSASAGHSPLSSSFHIDNTARTGSTTPRSTRIASESNLPPLRSTPNTPTRRSQTAGLSSLQVNGIHRNSLLSLHSPTQSRRTSKSTQEGGALGHGPVEGVKEDGRHTAVAVPIDASSMSKADSDQLGVQVLSSSPPSLLPINQSLISAYENDRLETQTNGCGTIQSSLPEQPRISAKLSAVPFGATNTDPPSGTTGEQLSKDLQSKRSSVGGWHKGVVWIQGESPILHVTITVWQELT